MPRGRSHFPCDSLTGRLHLLPLREHPEWDDYRNAMIRSGRCLIRITPTKAGSTVSDDFLDSAVGVAEADPREPSGIASYRYESSAETRR
jgi:hypothetical protein